MEIAKAIKLTQTNCKDIKCYLEKSHKYDIVHISFTGADEDGYRDGIYHMRVDFSHYPHQAPTIMMLNESGGYSIKNNICLVGITNDSSKWTPYTTIETIVTAIQAYMVPKNRLNDGTAMIRADIQTVKDLAEKSKTFKCQCGADHSQFHNQVIKKPESLQAQVPKVKIAHKQFIINVEDDEL